MISTSVDLGQILVAGLIGIVGYFIRKEISSFSKRIDSHDKMLYDLTASVSRLIGQFEIITKDYDGSDRRKRN